MLPLPSTPLRSSGSADSPSAWGACQRPGSTNRPAGRADSLPLAGFVSSSSLCLCFEKYGVQHVATATAAQTNRGLFAQQLSRAASAALHAQGGVRNSSPPPRLSRSQPGRKQRAQQAALAARVWGWQKAEETQPSNWASRCPAALRSTLIMTRNCMYSTEKGAPLHWWKPERAVRASAKLPWIFTGVKWGKMV